MNNIPTDFQKKLISLLNARVKSALIKRPIPKDMRDLMNDIIRELDEREGLRKDSTWRMRKAEIHKKMGIESDPVFYIDTINELLEMIPSSEKEINYKKYLDLMEKALPEVQKIYSAIGIIGFSGRDVGADEKWKKAALNRLNDSKKSFKYVKLELLESKDLYELSVSKERRDFQGTLLKKIFYDHDLKDFGAQDLYNLSKWIEAD